MLLGLKISNFLSYDNETELSLFSGKVRKNSERVYTIRNTKVLKCMSIFGSNASGKSNIVKALSFVKRVIVENKVPNGYTNKYFRLNQENMDKPSLFEITLLIENKIYIYGFKILLSKGLLMDEWLLEKQVKGTFKSLFRMNNAEEFFEVGPFFKEKNSRLRLKIYGDDCLKSNSLFLSNINDKKEKMYEEFSDLMILREIYMWFLEKLNIHFPFGELSFSPKLIESNIDRITKILNAFDTGITNVQIVKETPDKLKEKISTNMLQDLYENLLKNQREGTKSVFVARSDKDFYTFELDDEDELVIKTIQFAHEKNDIYFDLDEESDGTTRLLDLVEILLDFDGDKVFVFDEIERCLHPSITVKFLELFLELAKTRNTQLIITTHESRILAVDLLRNDEISYIEKNSDGSSSVISLDKLNLRSDKKIYQAFFELDGPIKAMPKINNKKLKSQILKSNT